MSMQLQVLIQKHLETKLDELKLTKQLIKYQRISKQLQTLFPNNFKQLISFNK